ncbi:MAG: glycosyltransferase family 2 protein [Candidatus Alcyoniella australis]|nr:glycosyltransferase family 2 protein [Candidatus Alcyoniella australis]
MSAPPESTLDQQQRLPGISICFPCLNDLGTIGTLVLLAGKVAQQVAEDYEIVIVDDESVDGSRELLGELAADDPRVRVLFNERNQGYGRTIARLLSEARMPYVFYTDGDGQYDVRELPLLVQRIGPDTPVVNGYKITRSDPWFRILLGRVYHYTAKLMFGLRVRDVDCDFRLFQRRTLESLDLTCNGGAVCVELVKKIERQGLAIAEVPVHHYFRTYGKSQFFNLGRITRVIREFATLWWTLYVRDR